MLYRQRFSSVENTSGFYPYDRKRRIGSGFADGSLHGETWVRNGLSHPHLATWQGRILHRGFALPLAASKTLGGPTLDGLLLARHRIIDSILDDLIRGGINQVIEVACGCLPGAGGSPRSSVSLEALVETLDPAGRDW